MLYFLQTLASLRLPGQRIEFDKIRQHQVVELLEASVIDRSLGSFTVRSRNRVWACFALNRFAG
jgi:hypothetical protein